MAATLQAFFFRKYFWHSDWLKKLRWLAAEHPLRLWSISTCLKTQSVLTETRDECLVAQFTWGRECVNIIARVSLIRSSILAKEKTKTNNPPPPSTKHKPTTPKQTSKTNRVQRVETSWKASLSRYWCESQPTTAADTLCGHWLFLRGAGNRLNQVYKANGWRQAVRSCCVQFIASNHLSCTIPPHKKWDFTK